jgi:hypothetical protein
MSPFFFFSSTKLEECGTGSAQGGWVRRQVGINGRGEVVGKGFRRVNMVQKMCTHACKCKHGTCRNYSKKEGREG